MENLINKIFPPKCVFCKTYDGKNICTRCRQECKQINSTKCIVCDKPTFLGTTHINCITNETPISSYSIFEYNGYVRDTIKNAKYSAHQFMALKELTTYGITSAMNLGYHLPKAKNLIALPIPLNKRRIKKRGFNQAEIICKIIAKQLNIKMYTKILQRTINTKRQHTSTRQARFKNVKDAFYTKYNLKNANIILVDDIRTSGATLLEATKTLYKANANSVHCITLSKMPKHRYNALRHGSDKFYLPSVAYSASKTMGQKPKFVRSSNIHRTPIHG